jgi:predicted MFS family arabinose efflux permease
MISAGGVLIACAAMILSATTLHSSYVNLGLGFATMALAFSIFVPASTDTIMTAVPPERSGGASAINQMTRQIGQSLGIALGGSIALSGYRAGFAPAGANLSPATVREARSSITSALETASQLGGAARQDLLYAAHLAFLHGVRLALFSAAGLAITGAIFARLTIPARRSGRASSEQSQHLEITGSQTIAELPID